MLTGEESSLVLLHPPGLVIPNLMHVLHELWIPPAEIRKLEITPPDVPEEAVIAPRAPAMHGLAVASERIALAHLSPVAVVVVGQGLDVHLTGGRRTMPRHVHPHWNDETRVKVLEEYLNGRWPNLSTFEGEEFELEVF
jgi:hypothetical protein